MPNSIQFEMNSNAYFRRRICDVEKEVLKVHHIIKLNTSGLIYPVVFKIVRGSTLTESKVHDNI